MIWDWFTHLNSVAALEKKRRKIAVGISERRADACFDSLSGVPEWLASLFLTPFPGHASALSELELVVIDIETSGLEPDSDRILSVGMVEINGLRVCLNTAEHIYIHQPQSVKPETAVINHIMPETLAQGVSLEDALKRLVERCAGKVMVAHCAAIEQQFLLHGLRRFASLNSLPLIWLDTLMLEKSLCKNRGKGYQDLRLSELRNQKGLPAYLAHNALSDAVATAELLLVLINEIAGSDIPRLGPLHKRSVTGRA